MTIPSSTATAQAPNCTKIIALSPGIAAPPFQPENQLNSHTALTHVSFVPAVPLTAPKTFRSTVQGIYVSGPNGIVMPGKVVGMTPLPYQTPVQDPNAPPTVGYYGTKLSPYYLGSTAIILRSTDLNDQSYFVVHINAGAFSETSVLPAPYSISQEITFAPYNFTADSLMVMGEPNCYQLLGMGYETGNPGGQFIGVNGFRDVIPVNVSSPNPAAAQFQWGWNQDQRELSFTENAPVSQKYAVTVPEGFNPETDPFMLTLNKVGDPSGLGGHFNVVMHRNNAPWMRGRAVTPSTATGVTFNLSDCPPNNQSVSAPSWINGLPGNQH